MTRFGIALTLSLAALTIVSADAASASPNPSLHLVGTVAAGRKMVVSGPSGEKTVGSLPAWASVERLFVSPSGKHAFVFAQLAPHQSRTAIVVDLAAAKITAAYHPGVGGSIFFAQNDDVVQIAGCGTACASLEVRDVTGRSLGAWDCAGVDLGAEVSPDKKLAACFGPQSLDVVDLTTGKAALSIKTPCTQMGQRDKFRWEAGAARFECYDDSVGDDVDVVASWVTGHTEVTKHAVQSP